MKVAVLNTSGKEAGRSVTLDADVFGIEPNDHAIYLDVKQYLANQRQGTHKAKERNEVAGSTKKLKRQKGTGGARAGSIKSPLFVGGGRVFGPRPRDYSFKLNKKLKSLAKKSALSYKAKDNNVFVVEDFTLESPKTKDYINILGALSVADKKTVLITSDIDKNLYLSSRNLKPAKVVKAVDINTYDILNAHCILLTESALPIVENTLKA
ncbi:MAG TPA: 50S ribosomal protein L4 [Bacteroidia bacterium]|nr:50S ribosomal protein L4 [Bacteroidia bacterium]HNT80231.1 50S ribosomal protein L4 [Bacteroidia bacterium]